MAKQSGKFYINLAENSIGKSRVTKVENGRGDHVKVYGTNEEGKKVMGVIPVNLKGNGTEFSIIKFLRTLGVLLFLGIFVFVFYITYV